MASIRPRIVLAALALSPFLFLACGGSESSNASGPQGTPLADAPGVLAKALCTAASSCLGPQWDLFLRGRDCETLEDKQIAESDFSLLQPAIDAHRVGYDGTKVEACASTIEKSGCEFFASRLKTQCPGILTGTVDAGGDCTLNGECKDGFCKMTAACPGSCTALASAGADCTKNDECKDGLVCSGASKTCTQQVAEGSDCGGTSKGECEAGLACAGATATTAGTCKKITDVYGADEGATCDPTTTVLCKSGLACALTGLDATTGTLTYKCEKPATSTSCHAGYPETCPQGQYCELTGLSSTPPTPDGACKPLPGDGEPCASANPKDMTKTFCANTAVCVSGTCKAVQNNGGACTTNPECFSSECVKGSCEPNECATAAK